MDATRALLDYYRALGVDCTVDDTAHDRFAESARLPAPIAEPVAPAIMPRPKPATIEHPQGDAAADAEAAATGARTLEDLQEAIRAFPGLSALANTGGFTFGSGAPAPLMIVDSAPGEGAGADLLKTMLAAIAQNEGSVYRAYFSPWRGAGATPAATQNILALFARRHIALAKPKVALLLGDFAKPLLSTDEKTMSLYARQFDLDLGGTTVAIVPSPSLAALRATPALKPVAWRALRLVAKTLA